MPFKLIALRPLKGCASKYLKNLKEGEFYTFYNEFKFSISNGDVKVIHTPSFVSDLYKTKTRAGKRSIDINISAIVGMNGSGKSSLLEIFFALVFIMSDKYDIIQYGQTGLKKLKSVQGISNEEKKEIDNDIQNIKEMYKSLKIEIYYAIEDTIYCIRFDNNLSAKSYIESSWKEVSIDFRKFFYTISINYSIHGLNSLHVGNWIESLFHKNDAYQTPIVLNPMRNEGVFNINQENHFAQSRLLSNVVTENYEIIGGKKIKSITFKVNLEKYKTFFSINLSNVIESLSGDLKTDSDGIFIKIYNSILGEKLSNLEKKKLEVKNLDSIIGYTIRKIFKIARTYKEYQKYYYTPKEGKLIPSLRSFDKYLNKLAKDRSHITLKLRQILNLVRFNVLRIDKEAGVEFKDEKIEIPIAEFRQRIKIATKKQKNETINFIPAAFFEPELIFEDKSSFYFLSSGEQQLIHSIQSIIYHIVNIESVFLGNQNHGKIKYNYVNIVLDEIELYFHPEFQRNLIKELLDAIKEIELENINSINVLFTTHSPFILSDIPIANVLHLQNGEKANPVKTVNQTFGANIHDLLANDFFLKKGFMGEFAKDRINSVIDYLTTISNEDSPWRKESSIEFINSIGEPLIKSNLRELYYQKFNDTTEIKREIERLTALIRE